MIININKIIQIQSEYFLTRSQYLERRIFYVNAMKVEWAKVTYYDR